MSDCRKGGQAVAQNREKSDNSEENSPREGGEESESLAPIGYGPAEAPAMPEGDLPATSSVRPTGAVETVKEFWDEHKDLSPLAQIVVGSLVIGGLFLAIGTWFGFRIDQRAAERESAREEAEDIREFQIKFAKEEPTGVILPDLEMPGLRQKNRDFTRSTLDGANLTGADLEGSIFVESSLRSATLDAADLGGSDMSGVDLRDASLIDAYLGPAPTDAVPDRSSDIYRQEPIKCAGPAEVRSGGANLSQAQLSGADLSRSDLFWAGLVDIRGENVEFVDAYAANSSWWRAAITWSDMSGISLRCADVRCARIWGTNLSGADLSEADLRDTHFTDGFDANYGHSDIDGVDWTGAYFNAGTRFPPNFDPIAAGMTFLAEENGVMCDA